MKFEFEPATNRKLTDQELIEDLKDLAQKIGHTPSSIEYDLNGTYSAGAYKRAFGSWLNAIKQAGLETSRQLRNRKIDDVNLFANLEKVWLMLGRQPRLAEMRSPLSLYSGAIYKNRFDGWNNALQAFIDLVNSKEQDVVEEPQLYQKRSDDNQSRGRRSPNLGLRWKVMNRDRFQCVKCGRVPRDYPGLELHVDHILAWSKGGKTVLNNLELLCSDCNLGKSDT